MTQLPRKLSGTPLLSVGNNWELYIITIKSTVMAKVSIYLNFQGNTEEAFNFYKSIFKTEFSAPLMRMKDIPAQPGMPPLPANEANAVMHVALPILGGTELQGTDMLESM